MNWPKNKLNSLKYLSVLTIFLAVFIGFSQTAKAEGFGTVNITSNNQTAAHYTTGPTSWGTNGWNGDHIYSSAPSGDYSVVPDKVPGYTVTVTPAQTLTLGGEINFNIIYTPDSDPVLTSGGGFTGVLTSSNPSPTSCLKFGTTGRYITYSGRATNGTSQTQQINSAVFHSDKSGCESYNGDLGTGWNITGQTVYAPQQVGDSSYSYDTNSYSCGRTQYDASYNTAGNGWFTDLATTYAHVFIGVVFDYGVDCVSPAQTGTVIITSNNQAAAHYTTGPTGFGTLGWNGNHTYSDAPVGVYSVTPDPVSGYTVTVTPAQTLTMGGTITFNIVYTPAIPLVPGTVTILSNKPNSAFYLKHPAGEIIGDKVDSAGSRIYTNYPVGNYNIDHVEQFAGYDVAVSPAIGTNQALPSAGNITFKIVYTQHNTNAQGYLDGADCSVIGGWSIDFDNTASLINIELYKDGPIGVGTLATTTTAYLFRSDINSLYNVGNHAFSITTPAVFKDTSSHTVYAYGVDVNTGARFPLLQSPRTIPACNIAQPQPSANLSVSKTVDKTTANVLDNLTYTITVVNSGPDNATGVVVTDILSNKLTFVSATSSVGSYATSTGLWTVGNLNNGASATLTIVAKVNAGTEGQTIPNTSTVTATQNDPTPGNNTSTVTTTVNTPPATTGKITFCLVIADVSNTVATSTFGFPAGIFSINLTNGTSSLATILQTKTWSTATFSPNKKYILSQNDSDCVTYTLPFGTYNYSQLSVTGPSWLSAKYNDQNSQPVNNVFDFFPYSSELFNATSTDDGLRNVNSDGQIILTAFNNDQTLVLYEVDGPAMCTLPPQINSSLTASGVVGTAFTYTVTASSTSATQFTATGLPPGLSFSTTTNAISGTPTTSGTFNVTLNAVNQCVGGLDTKILVITITTTAGPNANIGISKTVNKSSANVGDTLIYTITANNAGPSDATGVVITDILPTQLNLVSVVPAFGTYATSTGVWTIGNFTNGSSTSITITATIKTGTEGQTITNTAVGTATTNDPTPGNNTSTVTTSVNGGSACTVNCGPVSCSVNCGGGGCVNNCGGSGGPINPTLTISNEAVTQTVSGVAFLTWNTNLPATRRVVYDNVSHSVLDTTANYGYATSTALVPSPLLTSHGMVVGIDPSKTYYFREISTALIGNATSTVVGKELVLNPTTINNSCNYLLDYLRKDFNNNPVEVRKLQIFLRDLEGFTNLQITGVYDDATISATNAFQIRYKTDVLLPWGYDGTAGTDYVYITTKKKVNEIYCKRAFPVTVQQQAEIDANRAFFQSLQNAGINVNTQSTTTPANTTPTELQNNVVGINSTTKLNISNNVALVSTVATTTPVVTETGGIISRMTANVLSAFGFAPLCGNNYFGWLNLFLILIIIVISYLWYRERRGNRKIESINKEIDLK